MSGQIAEIELQSGKKIKFLVRQKVVNCIEQIANTSTLWDLFGFTSAVGADDTTSNFTRLAQL
jgi:hypothetical protein